MPEPELHLLPTPEQTFPWVDCAAKLGTQQVRVLATFPNSFHINQLMENHMKLRPLHDRVIIKRLEAETKSAGGIVIPDAAAEKPIKGEVIAVGTGKILDDGKVRPMAVKAGDIVLFGKYSGTEVKVDGDELLVMREEDLVAIIEK
jgi:chaperonin GroES